MKKIFYLMLSLSCGLLSESIAWGKVKDVDTATVTIVNDANNPCSYPLKLEIHVYADPYLFMPHSNTCTPSSEWVTPPPLVDVALPLKDTDTNWDCIYYIEAEGTTWPLANPAVIKNLVKDQKVQVRCRQETFCVCYLDV